MAFNFNWSPLIADTSRAREMLTTALNKSPKPPIIVDDIIVTELNLGSTPPELEILEIGDLAEDRFRGIFKMTYSGDAFLTLKTKVQANPLNTYLSRKPSFASPEPLAAASGLTIPLQITLSDIRLSGFVILVFSKQKGLTLVFRNDPLESLKVSSTFDTIPFVRDYLQKEIEGQLRVLFMEDLPAIIHRLSLRLWSTEYLEMEEEEERLEPKDTTAPIDPLATNPPDAIDEFGNPLSDTSTLTLDTASEIHASFSRKNVLRLAALCESQRTLSLFTPGVRDAVFRAWACNPDANAGTSTPVGGLTQSSLSRIQSSFNQARSKASSVASASTADTQNSRPSLVSNNSATTGLTLGSNRLRNPQRKRKKRVVDLRKHRNGGDSGDVSAETSTQASGSTYSEASSVIPEDEELVSTPKVQAEPEEWSGRERNNTVTAESSRLPEMAPSEGLLPAAPLAAPRSKPSTPAEPSQQRRSSSRPPLSHNRLRSTQQATHPLLRSLSFDKVCSLSQSNSKNPISPGSESGTSLSGGILEQAWMLKMAQEIARKVQDEKLRDMGRGRDTSPHGGLHHPQPQSSKAMDAVRGVWTGPLGSPEEIDAPPAYHA